MSENTPTTEHVRAQYSRQENYDDYYEGDLYLTPDGQISAQKFDRWLAEHDEEVREDYKGRVIDALENAKHNLDTSDPFTDGFLTALDEISKIIESTKKRATDSFGYL